MGMTIDERLEFLVQSTESLHASCQELHAIVTLQAEEAKKQRERDRSYIALIADVMKHWSNGEGNNGET